MKTNFTENFTRGGQVAMHRLRMFTQISRTTFLITAVATVMYLGFSLASAVSLYQWYLFKEHLYADFMLSTTFGNKQKALQGFTYPSGKMARVRSVDILHNKKVIDNKLYIMGNIQQSLWDCIWVAIVSSLSTVLFFVFRGKEQYVKKIERGNEFCSLKHLIKMIHKRNLTSDLKLGELPLIKNKETSHMLITGTTGAGKSNCLHTLIPQIRARGERAIIVDLTGDYISSYYQENHDKILNPFDARSIPWSLWEECLTEPQFDAFSEACVPRGSFSQDSFWENASSQILSTALQKLKGSDTQSVSVLYHILAKSSLKEYSTFFKDTDAAAFTDVQGDKTTLSIRATLVSHISFLKHLNDDGAGFSIRNWVADLEDKSWLFLSARADQRKTLIPLLSAWLDTAVNALMTLSPDANRRIWFIIDELPALQKLPSLELGLAELRKYGGCVVAGMQSMPQLITLYGNSKSQSILDLFNTKLFFRNTDPNTTAWISKVLDEAEISEAKENLSYGANTIRDGVSLSQQQKQKLLVLPTEIANLHDLECYLKLPGNWPISKMQMAYKDLNPIAAGFIQKVCSTTIENHRSSFTTQQTKKKKIKETF